MSGFLLPTQNLTHPLDSDVSQFPQSRLELINAQLGNIPHDETGMHHEKMARFLGSYGLSYRPFIAVSPEAVAQICTALGGNLSDVEEVTNEVNGGHVPFLDFIYVARNEQDLAETEESAIHEIAHANQIYTPVDAAEDFVDLAFQGKPANYRSGFRVKTDGHSIGSYFEEGFAEFMAHRYKIEQQPTRPDEETQYLGMGLDKSFRLPKSYSSSVPSFAAYGMQLLVAKYPDLFPSMLEARHSPTGLRDFTKRIRSINEELFTSLRTRHYNEQDFIAGTYHIIATLYNNDGNLAYETACQQDKYERMPQ